ncbi:MAG TPA: hypothetical protein VJX71_19730 [Methylomirabilota bacterium]|nr:hypothetical protein [Methylomirabilota bacterium]
MEIRWHVQNELRFPFGSISPDPDWFDPIGFPPPWPDRPWIYAVMVASANGVVGWRRSGPDDDPVLAILGGDDAREERVADRRHMRHLRCFGDVAIRAQTLREQPRLIQTPREPGEPPMPALYRFRLAHGLTTEPRHVIYSLRGGLDSALPVFNTPGVEPLTEPDALRRAHARLFAERGVRYLDCEGGQTVLRALRRAGLLDEVFLTETDVVVDESRHRNVLKIFEFEQEGADLIAEGRTGEASPWRFRRWRFSRR